MPCSTQISIDNPCHENWDQMTPADQGRRCASCQKTVMDFTEMGDRQILERLARRDAQNICGRFHADQLNRPLAQEAAHRSPASRIWHYMLAAFLFTSDASAQTEKVPEQMTQQRDSRQPEIRSPKPATPPDTLRGQILNNQGRPVSFATVMYGPKHEVLTNDSGRFSIPFSALQAATGLAVSAVGYETAQIPLSALVGWQENVITLRISQAVMGDVEIVVGKVAARKPRRLPAAAVIKDTLACVGLTPKALTVYPNPAPRGSVITVSVRLDTSGSYAVQLFSLSGVLEETVQIKSGGKSGQVLMNIPATLSPGAYFIRASNPNLKKAYAQQVTVL